MYYLIVYYTLCMARRLLHFIHTPEFDASLAGVLTDDQLAALQIILCQDPEAGDPVAGTGGIRKVRVAAKGHGKRGGARVIYYYHDERSRVFLLLAYPKNESDDLSEPGKKYLRRLVEDMRRMP